MSTTLLVLAVLPTAPIVWIGGGMWLARRTCRKRGHDWTTTDHPDEPGWVCTRCGHYI